MSLLYNLEPSNWSRNFDADEIEDSEVVETAPPAPTFQWLSGNTGVRKTENLIIALRGAASCFVHVHWAHKSAVGRLSLAPASKPSKPSTGVNLNEEVCDIFAVEGLDFADLALLVCHLDVPAEQAHAWTNTLFANIEATNVVVLDRLTGWKYNGDTQNNATAPLLRKIETDAAKASAAHIATIPYLEAPHLIEQVSAAILTHRQIRNKPAIAYLSFEDMKLLEVQTVQAFQPILQTPALSKAAAAVSKDTSGAYGKLLAGLRSRRPNFLYA